MVIWVQCWIQEGDKRKMSDICIECNINKCKFDKDLGDFIAFCSDDCRKKYFSKNDFSSAKWKGEI